MMRPLRLCAVLTLGVVLLLLALLLVALHPLRLTHAAFHHALCLCPVCVITDGLIEVSYGEYC